ncbi:MAG TPA: dihydrolipoyl dehydrogenase [Ktedonobacteraceae bacterium]|jgi:dihydrolipoamide dehydrogenase|nr:dihydrolipoyl dehydrogenase [Ktedonobacteraceae bacterium]
MATTPNGHYDLLVIGAGAAGSAAADTALQQGARVALVERDKIGGTCLNYGCDPTKTLLHIANMLYQAHHVTGYGLHIPEASVQWEAVQSYVHKVIDQIRGGTSDEASASLRKKGIQVFQGEASFTSPHEVAVGGRTIYADRIIIASGSKTLVPPIEGLEQTGFITNVQAVALPALPRRLAVVGGGAIGMEFAQMFHRFGVEITVLERSPQLLDKEDRELADMLCDLLTREGMRLETDAELRRVERTAEGKRLTVRCGQKEEERLTVDEILLAIGRRPQFAKLNLEAAGVETTERGIKVDETLRTSTPHIWAAGDVTGGLQFTHVAYAQGKLAAQNALSEQPRPFDDRVIPWVTFTFPSLAHVGKTEEQLRREGTAYKAGRMPFSESERAVANGNTAGLVKLLVDTQGKILGGHILGPRADDLIAPVVVAMQANLPAKNLADTIIPYPTLSEAVRWAADRV